MEAVRKHSGDDDTHIIIYNNHVYTDTQWNSRIYFIEFIAALLTN